jgi:hypothetical protein
MPLNEIPCCLLSCNERVYASCNLTCAVLLGTFFPLLKAQSLAGASTQSPLSMDLPDECINDHCE